MEEYEKLIGVLKFEYDSANLANKNDIYQPVKNEKGIYFTCTPYNEKKSKRPIMLSADKLLYITIITSNIPYIVARAKTHGFNDSNIATPEMMRNFPWTEHYRYYVDLYDIEVINGCISMGIPLTAFQKDAIPCWKQASYRRLSKDVTLKINKIFSSYNDLIKF